MPEHRAVVGAGLHHVQLAIPAGGEDRARAFWAGALGMTELVKPPELAARGGCWFRAGRLEVHLGVQEPFTPATKAHPGILVASLDEVVAALTAAGHEPRRDRAFPGFDRCCATDPFGNRLEFLQRTGPPLEIRLPEPGDEAAVRAAQAELAADGFDFAFDLTDDTDDFEAWCRRTRAHADGRELRDGWVRNRWEVALLDGEVVGRVSTRFELNDVLRTVGGHIGYMVRPAHRGRGIAGVLLRHGLELLAAEGIGQALVTCDDHNRASATVIEDAGGVLQDVHVDGPIRKRRYLVPTTRP